ncbi:hypothetical protein BDZ89DRAFT_1053847 [Hymenopellis radicata]|nr:hypothetical protein BDZ89DRAFT_1053847 [Hymenopellis radicata]
MNYPNRAYTSWFQSINIWSAQILRTAHFRLPATGPSSAHARQSTAVPSQSRVSTHQRPGFWSSPVTQASNITPLTAREQPTPHIVPPFPPFSASPDSAHEVGAASSSLPSWDDSFDPPFQSALPSAGKRKWTSLDNGYRFVDFMNPPLSAINKAVDQALAALSSAELGPLDLVLHIYQRRTRHPDYGTHATKEYNTQIAQVLELFFEDSELRPSFLHWITPHIVPLASELVADEMDAFSKSVSVSGTAFLTPKYIDEWHLSGIRDTAPVMSELLTAAAQTGHAAKINKKKKPDRRLQVRLGPVAAPKFGRTGNRNRLPNLTFHVNRGPQPVLDKDRLQPRSFTGPQPVATAYGRNQSRPVETDTDRTLAASFMPVGGPRAIAQGLPNVHKPRGERSGEGDGDDDEGGGGGGRLVVVVAVVVDASSSTRPSSDPSPAGVHPLTHLRVPLALVLLWRRLKVVSWYIHADSKSSAGHPPAPPSAPPPAPAPDPPPSPPGLALRMLPIGGAYAVRMLPIAGLTRPGDDSKSSPIDADSESGASSINVDLKSSATHVVADLQSSNVVVVGGSERTNPIARLCVHSDLGPSRRI